MATIPIITYKDGWELGEPIIMYPLLVLYDSDTESYPPYNGTFAELSNYIEYGDFTTVFIPPWMTTYPAGYYPIYCPEGDTTFYISENNYIRVSCSSARNSCYITLKQGNTTVFSGGGNFIYGRSLPSYVLSNLYASFQFMITTDTALNYRRFVNAPSTLYVDFWASATVHVSDSDPYANIDGESEISGGGTVSIPGFPALSASSTGIIGLFAPSATQMQQLADYMWTDFGGTGATEVEVLKEIVDALKRSISNPLDYVVGLNLIPSQGLTIGSSSVIKFGFTSSGVSMPRLANQFFTVDCGTLSFDYLCGNTFLDYAPYSKFSIYLPYIGVKTLDANDCVGHTIGVTYHGDVVTGGITAYITKDGSVMYQFSGCCALNIPLSSDGWGSTISGAVQIATATITGAVSGGGAGAVAGALKSTANVASNPSQLSPQVAHSGAVSGGAGCMGVQYPFIIREAVRFHATTHFNSITGYPSYYYRLLSDMTGFTSVYDVHLENVPATESEIVEIETLLKNGVII